MAGGASVSGLQTGDGTHITAADAGTYSAAFIGKSRSDTGRERRKTMRIVTIARESGAFDSAQEEAFCRAAGLRAVRRDTLEARFRELGADAEFMQHFDERKPRLMDSFFRRPDIYWETLQTAILQEAVQGNVALIGRGANFLLEGVAECFRLRFIAPPAIRAERIAELRGCTRDQALACIRKSDRERTGFCYYFYGKQWGEADSYDLTVNTAEIDMPALERMIPGLIAAKEVSPQGERRLRDRVLQQSIRYTLLVSENQEIPFLEIKCDAGQVTIEGGVSTQEALEKIEASVRKIDGVLSVENRLRVMQDTIPLGF